MLFEPFATAAPQLGAALVAGSPGLGLTSPFHFFTTGYGSSVVAIAAVNIIKSGGISSLGDKSLLGGFVHNCLMGLFGARLAAFLAVRSSTDSYKGRKETTEHKSKMSAMPFGARASLWASVSLFYVMMCFPASASLASKISFSDTTFTTGITMMAAGGLLEAVADHQKQAVKNKDANKFASSGVFRICRHPAYLGEVMFWCGNYLAGCPSMGLDWKQHLFAIPGLVGIYGIMSGASKRLAGKQDEKYGKEKVWQTYKSEVKGVLTPAFR